MRPRPRGPEVFPCTMRLLVKLSLGRSVPDQYCGSKKIFFGFGSGSVFLDYFGSRSGSGSSFGSPMIISFCRLWTKFFFNFKLFGGIFVQKIGIFCKLVHFVEILWIVNFIGSGSGQKFFMRPESGFRSGSGSLTLLAETRVTLSPPWGPWGTRGNPSFAHIIRHMAFIQYARPLASTLQS